MAECEQDDNIETPGYKPPAEKSLDEIMKADAEDESLRKYKEALLGNMAGAAGGEKKVTVQSLVIKAEDKTFELDFSKPIEAPIVMKEKSKYTLMVRFKVEGDIVPGLRLRTKITRKGVKVSSEVQMLGSYAPKAEPHEVLTPEEEAPHGMVGRGLYKIHCIFEDDDKKEWAKCQFELEIKKNWADEK